MLTRIILYLKIEENESELHGWDYWDIQNGYKNHPQTSHEKNTSNEEMPRRAIAPGLHMGLSLLLDVQEEEYYCSGTESVGFKVEPCEIQLLIYRTSIIDYL